MNTYIQVWLSAENETQAKSILSALVDERLIVGGSIIRGRCSKFWWKENQQEMPNYCYVMGFTMSDNKKRIEKEYSKVSAEEIPMASFIEMEGNKEFLDYIYKYTNRKEEGGAVA